MPLFTWMQEPNHAFARPGRCHLHYEQKWTNNWSVLRKQELSGQFNFRSGQPPIVPVLKRDGSVRICGDYKVTVNQEAKPDSHPLPKIDDMFTALTGGKVFTKLDLAHAYQQIPLGDASKKLVTINTQKGLFEYTRLPFGVSAAPAIFQRTMEGILRGIPQVCVYLDDILVTGRTEEEHLQRLDTVLQRLEKAGMRLKRNKCAFMLKSVEYLGHNISAEGLHPTQENVRAITDAPPPENVSQTQAFLGLLWQIPTQPLKYTSTTLQAARKTCYMGMG